MEKIGSMDIRFGSANEMETRTLYSMNVNGREEFLAIDGDLVAAARIAMEIFAGARINCIRCLGEVQVSA